MTNFGNPGGQTFSFLSLIVSILFVATFLSSRLEEDIPWIGLADEALVAFVLLVSVLRFSSIKRQTFAFLCLSLFAIYVLLTSYFSPYYQGLELTLTDIALFLKPLLVYFALMTWPASHLGQIKMQLLPLCFLYLFSAVVFYFLNLFSPIFPQGEVRFGIASYEFIANNEGEFANLVMVSGLLLYALSQNEKVRIFALFSMSFLALASLRFKAIVLTASFLMLALLQNTRVFEKRHVQSRLSRKLIATRMRAGYGVALLPLALALGAGQFAVYFLSGLTPRSFLFWNSLEVATDFFPFGSGAGTYGSAVAKLQYSELYNSLGFYSRWGLSEADGRFLNDSFWPMVMAQYGVIGLIIIVPLYARIAVEIYRHWAFDSKKSIAAVLILFNLILSTIGSAILIGGLGVILIVALVIIVRDDAPNGLRHG